MMMSPPRARAITLLLVSPIPIFMSLTSEKLCLYFNSENGLNKSSFLLSLMPTPVSMISVSNTQLKALGREERWLPMMSD